jgi:two-component system LytT family response regulator
MKSMPCGHFEAYALAYLLKTVDDKRFAAAIDRARKLLDATSMTQMAGRILKMDGTPRSTLALHCAHRRAHSNCAEEVDWISAAGDYTETERSWAFSSLARNGESNGAEARPN